MIKNASKVYLLPNCSCTTPSQNWTSAKKVQYKEMWGMDYKYAEHQPSASNSVDFYGCTRSKLLLCNLIYKPSKLVGAINNQHEETSSSSSSCNWMPSLMKILPITWVMDYQYAK